MHPLTHKLRKVTSFNINKLYKYNFLVLLLTAIGYFAYVGLTALMQGKPLTDILHDSPYTSVMLMVVFLNILVGYWFWLNKDYALRNTGTVRLIFITLTICQLALGNLLVVMTSGLTFFNAIQQVPDGKAERSLTSYAIVGVAASYVICVGLILLVLSRS